MWNVANAQLEKTIGAARVKKLEAIVKAMAKFHGCLRESFDWLRQVASHDACSLGALQDGQGRPHPILMAIEESEVGEICTGLAVHEFKSKLHNLIMGNLQGVCDKMLPPAAQKVCEFLVAEEAVGINDAEPRNDAATFVLIYINS